MGNSTVSTETIDQAKLTARQEMLLRLIIKEHVQTASTVASRTLVERYKLNISPATVRNEMARLEESGYLSQPHTSAGRVPTEKGFRYFVKYLMDEQALSVAERRMIAHQFYQARDHIEQWLPLASSVLARAAQAAAILTTPRTTRVLYKHLELIATHGRAVLLILVLEGGTVEQQMLVLSEPMHQQALRDAADRLNQICVGLNADQIEGRVREFPPLETDIINIVLSIMRHLEAQPPDEIYYHGLSDLLQAPEFAAAEDASTSLGVGNVRILIGGEGRWDELRTCSIILTRYGVPNYATGALGVMGPIRMHYGRAVSAVRFVANVLGELVYEIYQPNLEIEAKRPPTETPNAA